jgi:hypothetical protein
MVRTPGYRKHPTIRRAIFMIAGVFGGLVVAYALYRWSGFGFTLGPGKYSMLPDPSAGYRYLFLVGLTIVAYSLFELYRPAKDDAKDEHSSDNLR